jgi:hypothetical protein
MMAREIARMTQQFNEIRGPVAPRRPRLSIGSCKLSDQDEAWRRSADAIAPLARSHMHLSSLYNQDAVTEWPQRPKICAAS